MCSWVLNTFKYINFTTSADHLKEFVSLIYTFLLHGFRQQQDSAKAFWRVNKPKHSSLSSHALSCGSSGELSAGITLVYQCLSCTGEPKIGLLVWSVGVAAHSVSHCAADKLLLPEVSLMPSPLHKISQSCSCQLWQSLGLHKHHPKIKMNSFLMYSDFPKATDLLDLACGIWS